MSQRIAWIGLGVMGFPMAGHLSRAGHEVTVYNRTQSRADDWVAAFGGDSAGSPRAAAEGADVVLCCVGNDDDVREVLTGPDGAIAALTDDTVLVDHTTTSARLARSMAGLVAECGARFLDAPVSGGQAGAENGVLSCMVGGDAAAFERAEPVLQCYSRMLKHMGPTGYGQLTKMVNQICIAGLVQGLAEGLHFAQANELDGEAVLEVISKGAAQSWQMENRGQTMLRGEFDFGFAVDWMRKDLAIVLEQAQSSGARLPVTALVDELYAEVQRLGGERWDTSSLIVPLERSRQGD